MSGLAVVRAIIAGERSREIVAQMCGGRDLKQLPAHTHMHTHTGVLHIVGEVGTDLTQWPTEKHFTA